MSIEVISLLYIGILLLLAKAMEEGFRRVGLVPFVGPIIIGIISGDGGLGFVHINDIISFVTSLGIVFLLFLAGAEEFDINTKISGKFFISSIIQLSLPLVIVVLSLYELGGFSDILLLSVPLAMSSAGPLTRLLMDVGMSKEMKGNYLFYQVIINEIIAVILFSVFQSEGNIVISLIEVIIIVVGIVASGRYIAIALERLESIFKAREIEFATLVSAILIIGFLADTYKFNSAIAALFLGFLLKEYLSDRPELREKLHAFTYGFFEPLFFVSIGLYFVKVTFGILTTGVFLAVIVILSKTAIGGITSKLVNLGVPFNALGTSIKGGVDSSLLVTALSLNYITGGEYSEAILAITVSTLIIPLLFKRLNKGEDSRDEKTKLKLSQNITALNKDLVSVSCDSILRDAVTILTEKKVRGVIVVDKNNRPIGYISMNTVIEIDPSLYDKMKVCNVDLDEVALLNENAKIADALRKFRETEKPLIGVVDNDGKLVNVLYEREIMRLLIND